jgi:hypothetical protein
MTQEQHRGTKNVSPAAESEPSRGKRCRLGPRRQCLHPARRKLRERCSAGGAPHCSLPARSAVTSMAGSGKRRCAPSTSSARVYSWTSAAFLRNIPICRPSSSAARNRSAGLPRDAREHAQNLVRRHRRFILADGAGKALGCGFGQARSHTTQRNESAQSSSACLLPHLGHVIVRHTMSSHASAVDPTRCARHRSAQPPATGKPGSARSGTAAAPRRRRR